jgi:Adenylate and Guanylate cyclase catalytic domain
MESNGVKGRIHCSEATAAALIAKGKESWLSPREDKIVAKGKGEMQTYFVVATSSTGRESVRSGISAITGSTTKAGPYSSFGTSVPPEAAWTNVSLDACASGTDADDRMATGIDEDIEV